MGGKRYERNHAAPLRDQFWGAFVGADPPEEVPVLPSGEMWMYTGTLPSSGYSGFALLRCGAIPSGTGRWEKWGMFNRPPRPFYNQFNLLPPPEHSSLKQLLARSLVWGRGRLRTSSDCGFLSLSLAGQSQPRAPRDSCLLRCSAWRGEQQASRQAESSQAPKRWLKGGLEEQTRIRKRESAAQ